jgi:hypothetical protein
MFNLGKVIAGIGVLIAIYLLVSNADQTAKIIQTISSNSIAGITTLQGR